MNSSLHERSHSLRDKIAIVVISCDNYSDLWLPFFELFQRYWSDCPFNVYLVTNEKQPALKNVTSISVGKDISWSDNLASGLKKVPAANILLFVDDLFLIETVDTRQIMNLCEHFTEIEANFLRFVPKPKPDKEFDNSFGLISEGAIYRVSTVLSLWKKSVLLDLLKSGESAWDFEVYGTIRADKYDGFYSTWYTPFPIVNCVIKGKWQRNALRKVRSFGVEADLTKRDVMTLKDSFMFKLILMRHALFQSIPAKHQRVIKNFLTRGKSHYVLGD
jgi:hypothetical protein